MPIEIDVNEKGLIIQPVAVQSKKQLIFSEAQLLKGLTAKKAHADELARILHETVIY